MNSTVNDRTGQSAPLDVLLTWVGARDPYWKNSRTGRTEPGPVLSLLRARSFDKLYVFLNLYSRADDFRARASGLQREIGRHFPKLQVKQQPLDVVSVIDHQEIFRVMNDACQRILREEGHENRVYYAYLSPGTPTMQTVWVLLVQSGLLPARMIEATPPDLLLLPDIPSWREVDLSIPNFPQIVSPDAARRELGILGAQIDNLAAENRALHAEVELIRAGAAAPSDDVIAEEFQLRDYLQAQERAMYVRAIDQAQGSAAAAARLLGIDPAAFRARAVTLGIRPRRQRTSGL